MAEFNWVTALSGGVLIGLASSLFLLTNGKIAGISGIFRGLISFWTGFEPWRFMFIIGLVAGGALFLFIDPNHAFEAVHPRNHIWIVALGGILVGFGARLGSGCTSGHGVCGVGRLSPRSIVSVVSFTASGALTVYLAKEFL